MLLWALEASVKSSDINADEAAIIQDPDPPSFLALTRFQKRAFPGKKLILEMWQLAQNLIKRAYQFAKDRYAIDKIYNFVFWSIL